MIFDSSFCTPSFDLPGSRYSGLYGKTSGIHLSDLVTKTYVIKESTHIVEARLPHG